MWETKEQFARRIQPIYKFLDWRWTTDAGEDHVPTVRDIVAVLNELTNQVKFIGGSRVGTGGLFVTRDEEGCIGYGFEIRANTQG